MGNNELNELKEQSIFNIGDVVRLKTDNVQMVIESMPTENTATCAWHDKYKKPHKETYHIALLVHVEKQQPTLMAKMIMK